MIDWKEKYMREVEGLNNEGEPIGGDPPSGLRHAYEALKAENEAIQKELTHWKANHADLKERLHVATHRTDLPSDRLPLFDRLKAENEAQAKRIAELERKYKEATGWVGKPTIEMLDVIGSLRKQVEELLGASRVAITALAHTSQKNKLYDEAYERLDSAISFVAESKNGDSK